MAHFKYYNKDFHNYFLYEDYDSDTVVKVPVGPNPDCCASHLDLTGVALRTQVINNIVDDARMFGFWKEENKPSDGSLDYEYAINTHNSGQVPVILISPRHVITTSHYFCSGRNCSPCRSTDVLTGEDATPCDNTGRDDGCGSSSGGDCAPFPGENGEVVRLSEQEGTAGANLSLSSTPAISLNQDWPEDARDFKTLVFMNKDGEKFTRNYQLLSLQLENNFMDHVILELDEPIGEEQGIAVYNKVLGTISNFDPFTGSIVYGLDAQSRIYHRKITSGNIIGNAGATVAGTAFDFPQVGYSDIDPNIIIDGGNVFGYGEVKVYGGDSGSPSFIYSEEHGTVLQWRPGTPVGFFGFTDSQISQFQDFLDTFNQENGTEYTFEKITVTDSFKEIQIPAPPSMSVLDPSPLELNATEVFCDTEIEYNSTEIISARSNTIFADTGGDEFIANFDKFELLPGLSTQAPLHPETNANILYRNEAGDIQYRGRFSSVVPENSQALNLPFTAVTSIIPTAINDTDSPISVNNNGIQPTALAPTVLNMPLLTVPSDFTLSSEEVILEASLFNANGENSYTETVPIVTGKSVYDVSISLESSLEAQSQIRVTFNWPEDVVPTPRINNISVIAKDMSENNPADFEARITTATNIWPEINLNTYTHTFTIPCEAPNNFPPNNVESLVGKNILISFNFSNIVGSFFPLNEDPPFGLESFNSFFDLGQIQDTASNCSEEITFHDISVGDEGDSQFGFIPQTINDASVGDVLRFTWGNDGLHNVVSGECVEGTCTWDETFPDDPFRSGDLQQGKGTIWEWTIPPEAAGSTIPYFCEAHGPGRGMVGFISIK